MSAAIVQIYDIMACNVYMDFENTGLRGYPGSKLPEYRPEQVRVRGPQ